uniref:Dual specificity phosphatase 19b n=1 Tax=Labrus bergylta TaxID=56723 RepID=A0A3Q3EBS1_9LABR
MMLINAGWRVPQWIFVPRAPTDSRIATVYYQAFDPHKILFEPKEKKKKKEYPQTSPLSVRKGWEIIKAVQKQEASEQCKLNLSETGQILQNELEPSVFSRCLLSFLFIYLPPPFQLPPAPSLCPLTQSHSGGVMAINKSDRISLLPRQNILLNKSMLRGRWLKDFHVSLSPCQVSHVLNVAYGVNNLFPDQFVYKTLEILDLPDTDITTYLGECSSFIDQAREQDGVVLVHCNAGVSRASSIVIGYLMLREGLKFDDAYGQVKLARPSICPNPGFYRQLQNYEP